MPCLLLSSILLFLTVLFFLFPVINAVMQLIEFAPTEQLERLAILLNCTGDANVECVLRKALRELPLVILASIFEEAMLDVLKGTNSEYFSDATRSILQDWL